MDNVCTPAPPNKKEYITDIGKILVEDCGKKEFYKPEEVEKAHKKSKWHTGIDFSCWGMSTFSTHSDFDKHHELTGEACNYVEMKTEMLNGLSKIETANMIDVSNIDIDTSWLDLGDVFGDIFTGIGEIILGIFDGI